ncbi:hypothetical protein Syun_016398 [Stephania yunnanensis]|uniref:Uncharacterized protein n=1 Tax=Stephania yunnanensis TaxID=152371 RepID=A0AAP0P4V3_9MAGN
MATRVVALENQARLAISRPPLFLIRAGFASSSSSSSSSLRGEVEEGKPNSGEAKPGKKLADRLASVMDAIHDRSLPPELRGRRNAVRLVFRYNLIVPFGRQMFGLNWEKELDRLKKQE